jgi:hypothetical protein
MLKRGSIRLPLAIFLLACALLTSGLRLLAAVPTAPTNLSTTITGQIVTLTWTASANSPTQYLLQAGFAPGQTALSVSLNAAQTSFTASAGPGTYYARIYAVNAEGTSAASNEVTVVITSTCANPSIPLNLRAMQKGAEIFLFWVRPQFGAPNGYSIQAGVSPGGTIVQIPVTGTTMNTAVASGTYFARVIPTSTCGNGPATTPDIPVTFPSNSVRVADPDPGTVLGMPDITALVDRLGRQFPPTLANSCPTGRKYEPNPWINFMVDQLRTYDTRFGYNAKPTRTSVDNDGFPVIIAGDEIAYFRGAGAAQGSEDVYAIDILFNHCDVIRGGAPELTYRDIAPERAIWTGAGRFTGDVR